MKSHDRNSIGASRMPLVQVVTEDSFCRLGNVSALRKYTD